MTYSTFATRTLAAVLLAAATCSITHADPAPPDARASRAAIEAFDPAASVGAITCAPASHARSFGGVFLFDAGAALLDGGEH